MKYLIAPGLGNSGPLHWQTFWEKSLANAVRVEQADWDSPERTSWVERLDRTIAASSEPVVLIAHSLAVSLVAHWARTSSSRAVAGALLVSPSDVDLLSPSMPQIRSFAPMPTSALAFPTVVVASRNDPYVEFERARSFAELWGSVLVDVGELGHINSDSRLGEWPLGRRILAEFVSTLK